MTRLSVIIVLYVALAMSHPGSAGEDIVIYDNNRALQKINESLSKYKDDLAGIPIHHALRSMKIPCRNH